LGPIIAQFKSIVTKHIWQRNYYEHIIRNDREMGEVWHYIQPNPVLCADDDENPAKLLTQ
jgi:putative transposase